MKIFVCGLAFDFEREHVLLLQKNRPRWQAGKLNGLGGLVNHGESPERAMAREFREETKGAFVGSILYLPTGWHHVVTLAGDDWQCLFFRGSMNILDLWNAPFDNDVGERICLTRIDRLGATNAVPNLKWLVPFALSADEYHGGQLPLVLHEASPGAIIRAAEGKSLHV